MKKIITKIYNSSKQELMIEVLGLLLFSLSTVYFLPT